LVVLHRLRPSIDWLRRTSRCRQPNLWSIQGARALVHRGGDQL